MKKIYFILVPLFLLSCTNNRNTSAEKSNEAIAVIEEKVIVPLSKLNVLLLLPQDSLIKHFDLSNDSLYFFPDLSNFTIQSLDLSHNQIDTIIIRYLPKGIERLNVSFNLLRYFSGVRWCWDNFSEYIRDRDRVSSLTELNLSNNNLTGEFTSAYSPIERLNVSHNDLVGIALDCFTCPTSSGWQIDYLNISHNSQLSGSNVVLPEYIILDTIIRNSIADNEPITLIPSPPPPPLPEINENILVLYEDDEPTEPKNPIESEIDN